MTEQRLGDTPRRRRRRGRRAGSVVAVAVAAILAPTGAYLAATATAAAAGVPGATDGHPRTGHGHGHGPDHRRGKAGVVLGWGDNDQGQLGDGTTTSSLTPVQLTGVGHAIAFAATGQSQHVLTDATPPTARLSVAPSNGRGPLTVTADATASTAGSSPIATYTIDFGEGSSNDPQATHTYANAGRYEVTLRVTDANGLSAETTAVVTVSDPSVDGTPGISTEGISGTPGCAHCVAVRVTSSGTAPLVIAGVAPAEHSSASIYSNTCGGQLEIGQSCEIGWVALPSPPGWTNHIVIYHNAPGGSTTI